jgi:hypothetical protein
VKELLVLVWTDHFFGESYLDAVTVEGTDAPTARIEFTTDRAALDSASAVWFHGPSIRDFPPKRPDQPWVLMSMESDANYPNQAGDAARARFDVHMTYRLDADVPAIYPNWREYGDFSQPVPNRVGPSAGASTVYIASNPVPFRDAYVVELMRHLRVDSLGSCLNNRSMEEVAGPVDGAQQVMAALGQYKFALAFENSASTDYVTEKLFRPLACGTVPVSLGAQNVRDFVPDDDAVIVAADFASPQELAGYLTRLDHDDDAYEKHLRWRTGGASERFKELVDLGSVPPMARLARKLAHGCDRSCRCGGRVRDYGVLP